MIRPLHRRLIYLTTAFALSLLSCGREVTGPENGISFGRARMAALAVEPVMPELLSALDGASAVEPFERVRVVLRRTDGSIALDTMVPFPIGATEIALTLLVPIPVNAPAEGLPLSVTQSYINAAGDTVFRGGPLAVIARPVGSEGADTPVQVPVVWQGTGSDAARVAIAPKPTTVFSGSVTTFTGTAFTAADAPIPGTPFIFYTLDSTRVQVNAVTGVASWLPVRGSARIVGALPNGLRADTATITVALPASKLVLGAGDAQTGILNAPLSDSIVVRTLASDDVPVAGVIVTFAVATGGGALTALEDTSDANGNVSTKWTLGTALGAQSITATAAGLTGSPLTLTATAQAGEPVALEITQEPSSGVAGVALTPALTVTARDAFGNVATGFSGSVTVAIADGQAPPLGGTLTRAATAGVATFSDLSIAQVGNWALAVTSGALTADTSSAIAIAPGAAAALQFVMEPIGAVAGEAFAPPVTVRARDAFGNVATGFTGNVTLTLADGGGATLQGTATRAAVAGMATFEDLSIHEVGTGYGLVASSGALAVAASGAFNVTPAAASQLVIISGDGQSAALLSLLVDSLIVEARDQFGNVVPGATVNFGVLTGGGTPSSASVVTGVTGRAGVRWTLGSLVGAQTLQAALDAAPTVTVTFSATGTVGAPSQVVIVTAPTSGVAGSPLTVVAEVRDAFGNVVPTYTGQLDIAFDANPAGATLFGTLTANAVAGVATFNAFNIQKAGSGYTLVVNTVSESFASDPTAVFDVVAGPTWQFGVYSGNNQTVAAGSAFPQPLQVRVLDAFDNPKIGHPTHWSEGGVVTLGTVGTVLTDSLGIATNTATAGTTLGPQSNGPVVITDGHGSLTIFEHIVVAAGPTSITIASGDGQSGSVASTLANPLVVEVRDAFSNLIEGVSVQWAVTSGDANVTIGTVLTDANGQSMTELVLHSTAGPVTVTATVAGLDPVEFTATILGGAPSYPDQLIAPAGGTAGTALPSFAYAVYDAFGNISNAYSGIATVTLQKANGAQPDPIILSGDTVNVVAGVATWDALVIGSAGQYRIVADFGPGIGTYVSAILVIDAADPSVLTLVDGDGQTGTVGTSLPGALRARVTDAFGNGVAGVTVNFNVSSGIAELSALTPVTDAGGNAETVVTLDTLAGPVEVGAFAAGLTPPSLTYTLMAEAGAASVVLAVSGDEQSAQVGSAAANPVVVKVTDQYGNAIAGAAVEFISSVSDDLSFSDTTVVTGADGLAQTTVIAGSEVGTRNFGASVSGAGSVGFTLDVAAGAAAGLVVLDAIANTAAGEALTAFRVEIRDSFGNKVATASDSILIEIESGPDGAQITGTAWLFAVSGEALFNDIVLETAGAYVLRATAEGLAAAATNGFVVAAGPAHSMTMQGGDAQTGGIGGLLANPLQVKVLDVFGNPVPGAAVAWEVTVGDASVGTETSLTSVDGVAEMSVQLGTSAGSVEISASIAVVVGSPVLFSATTEADAAVGFSDGVVPSPTTAGESITSITVNAVDAFLNVATGFTGEVTVSFDFGPGTLAGTTTVSAVAGVATFTDLSFEVAGTYRLRFTAGGLTDLVSNEFEIVAGAAVILEQLTDRDGQSAPVTQSLPSPLAVRARDAFGNVVSGAMVVWTPLSAGVVLSVDTTYTDGGGLVEAIATFGTTAANFAVEAALTGTAEVVNFTMTALPEVPSLLNVDGGSIPDPTVAGTTFSSTPVRVFDQYNNLTSNSALPVSVSVFSGPTSSIGGTLSVVPVNGIASFDDLVLTEVGSYVLEFTHDLASSEQIVVEILPAGAASLAVLATPSSVTAGSLLTGVQIQLRDAFGNHATAAEDSVYVSIVSGPPDAAIFGDTAFKAVGGSLTLDGAFLNKVGSYVLELSGPGLTVAQTDPIEVTAGALAAIAMVSGDAQTDSVTAYADTLIVRLTDAYGNGVDGAAVLWSAPGDSASLAYAQTEADVDGYSRAVVQFGIIAGPVTITADAGAITGSPVEFTLTITAGSPETVEMVSAPDTVQAPGTGDVFVVRVADAYGNTVESFTDVVEVTLNAFPDDATFPGFSSAAVAGVATFDALAFDVAGLYTLFFSSVPLSGVEHYLEVTAGAAAALTLVSGDAQTGYATLPLDQPLRVRVTDAFGNPVEGDTVRFIVLTGGGLVGGEAIDTVLTDANGEASTIWTLGAAAGEGEVQADVDGLAPVSFTATAEALAGNIVWSGAVSGDWENAANWLGGVTPTASDSVWIRPGTPNQPTMTASATIAGLTIDPWATLVIAEQVLTVNGKLIVPLQAWHTIDTGGDIIAAGSETYPIAGQFPRLSVQNGTYEVQGYVGVAGNGGLVQGDIEISSSGHVVLDGSDELGVAGSLTTASGGRFSQTAGTLISIAQQMTLGGGAAGTLSGGLLSVLGDITITGENSVSADSAHVLRVGGGSQSLLIENYMMNQLGSLDVDAATTLDLVQGLALRGDVTIAASSYVTTEAQYSIYVGGVLTDPSGGRWGVDLTVFTGTNVLATTEIPGSVYLHGANALTGGLEVGGGLYVRESAGSLTLNGHQVVVGGVFYTDESGRLVMDQASDALSVAGNAFFYGGNSVLTAGATTFERNVTVGAGTAGEPFRAFAAHVTTLSGAETGTLEFAAPGFGAGQSHFGSLTLTKAETQVYLGSNVFVDGVLTATTGTQAVHTEGTGYGITARGADLSSVVFSAASLRLVEGAAITALQDLSFVSGVSEQTMLTIERPGGSYTLDSPSFDYSAYQPVYVRLVDTDDNGDVLTLTVVDPEPTVHLDRIQLVDGAQLNGWDAFGTFVWTGSFSNDWWEPLNWNLGVVPMPGADVLVPNETPNVTMAMAASIGSLTWQSDTPLNLQTTLTITGSLTSTAAESAGISCNVDGKIVMTAQGAPAQLSGIFNCPLIQESGEVQVPDFASLQSLTLQGTALFNPGESYVEIAEDLRTADAATLQMTSLEGTVEVFGNARFASSPTPGQLTGGQLLLYGDFTQDSTANGFNADPGHGIVFRGSGQQTVSFGDPDSTSAGSRFGRLILSQGSGGSVVLASWVDASGALWVNAEEGVLESSGGAMRLVTRGAPAGSGYTLEMRNVQWHIVDGEELEGTLYNVRFTNQATGVTQASFERASGSVSLNGWEFDTEATSTTYLSVTDYTGSGDGVFTVSMVNPVPAFHGGLLVTDGVAVVEDWSETAQFVWVSTSDTEWDNGDNWLSGVVPSESDSVTIPAGPVVNPALPGSRTIRAFVNENPSVALTIGGEMVLTVTERLTLHPTGMGILCGGTSAVHLDGEDVKVSGRIGSCLLEGVGGTATLEGNLTVGWDLHLNNDHVFVLAGHEVDVSGNLWLGGTSVLRMEDPSDALSVLGTVEWGGGAHVLTEGTLSIGGSFLQVGTGSLQASGSHTTVFFEGSCEEACSPQGLAIADNASTFANLVVSEGSRSGSGTITALTEITLGTDAGLLSGGPVNTTRLVGTESSVLDATILRISGEYLHAGALYAGSVEFTGTDQELPSKVGSTIVGWPEVNIIGSVMAVTDGTTGDSVMIRGDLIIRDGGQLTVGRPGVSTAVTVRDVESESNFRTETGGTLRMQEADAVLVISGIAEFAGGDQTGLLTAGTLYVESGFYGTGVNSFIATDDHHTILGGNLTVTDYPIATGGDLFRFGTLELVGGLYTVARSVEADVLIQGDVSTYYQGAAGLRTTVHGDITGGEDAVITTPHLTLGGVFAHDGQQNVDTLVLAGSGQQLRMYSPQGFPLSYERVEITGDVTTLVPPTETLTLKAVVVRENGNLRLGHEDESITIAMDSLRTSDQGTIEMLNGATLVQVYGPAIFAGGSTAGKLKAGDIRYYGGFHQISTTSPSSYQADSAHFSTFQLGGSQVDVSFDDPGFGPTQSRFSQLVTQGSISGWIAMGSDIAVDRQFSTLTSTVTRFVAPEPSYFRLHSGGAAASYVEFNRVGWTLGGTWAVTATLSDITFKNQDPEAVQWRIARDGAQTVQLLRPTFETEPTTGRYLQVEDDVLDDLRFTIEIEQPNPIVHSGFLEILGEAIVTGWEEDAVENVWTGAVDTDWAVAGNWSLAVVPSALTDVRVPDVTNQPVLTGPGTYVTRNLVVEDGSSLDLMFEQLEVRGNITLDGNLHGAGVGSSVLLRMRPSSEGERTISIAPGRYFSSSLELAPPVSGSDSVFRLLTPLHLDGALRLGSGRLALDGHKLSMNGDLIVEGQGRFSMLDGADSVIVAGSASFDGASTDGLLNAGTLQVGGSFTQLATESGASFLASGTHRTVLPNAWPLSFATGGYGAGQSRFANLQFRTNYGTTMLGSDLYVDGQLIATDYRVLEGTPGTTVYARGTGINGVELTGVSLAVLDGAPVDSLRFVTFNSMDPAVTQLSISRPSGSIALSSISFSALTSPDAGKYLVINDTNDSDGQPLSVALGYLNPLAHGGFLEVLGGAQVTGWNEFAFHEFLGTESGDFDDPDNWSNGVVPQAADVVKVNNAGEDPLIIDAARTVASFEMMAGATFTLSAPLTVVNNIDLGEGTTTCSAGNVLVVDASSVSSPFAFVKNFNAACNLTVVEGEVYLYGADTSRFNNVVVGGTATLDAGSHAALRVHGGLTIQGSAAVQTVYSVRPIIVDGTATLGGRTDASVFGSSGRLILLGNVVEATPVATSTGHWIVLGDENETSPPTRTYTVTHGGTSAIDNLRIHAGQWDVSGIVRARELHMVGSTTLNGGRVVVGMQDGLGGVGVLQTSSASAITTEGFSFRGATNLANGIFAPDTADFYGQLGETPQSIRRSSSSGTNLYQLIRVFQPARMVDFDASYSIGKGLEVIEDGVLTFGNGTDPVDLQFDADGYLRTFGIEGRLRFITSETSISVDSLHIENAGASEWSYGSIFARSVVQRNHLGTQSNLDASGGDVSFHLTGTGTVDFESPTASKFGSLYLVGESDVTLASDVQVTKQLARYDAYDGAVTVRAAVEGMGPTPLLQVGGGTDFDYSADPVTFRNVRLEVSYLEGLGPEQFNNVTFTGMNPEVVFLTVYMTGNDTRTFSNIDFGSPVTTGGFFYFLPSPDAPAIEFINASPAFGCFAIEPCVPGDQVPDPNVANLTWTGAADDGDWGNPANWNGAAVPSGNSQVTIPGSLATTYPTVNGSFSVGQLQIDASAAVTIETESKLTVYDNLAVFGDLFGQPGGVIEMRPSGVVYLSHSGGAFEPEFRIAKGLGDIEGAVLLATNVAVESAVDIRGGALALNGYTFTALDDFTTSDDGILMMTGVLDVLEVYGTTVFNGGSTDGYLTSGVIRAHGNFVQSNDGAGDDSFAPSGSHTLAFVGSSPADVYFASAGTPTGYSKIQNLAMQKDVETIPVAFQSNVYVADVTALQSILDVLVAVTVNVSGTVPTGTVGIIRVDNGGTFFVGNCDDQAVVKISAENQGSGFLSPEGCFAVPPP